MTKFRENNVIVNIYTGRKAVVRDIDYRYTKPVYVLESKGNNWDRMNTDSEKNWEVFN